MKRSRIALVAFLSLFTALCCGLGRVPTHRLYAAGLEKACAQQRPSQTIRLVCGDEPVTAESTPTPCQEANAAADHQECQNAGYTINYDIYGYENYGYYYGVASEDGYQYVPYQYGPRIAQKYQGPIAAPPVDQEPTLAVAPEEDPMANAVEAPPVAEAEVDGDFQAYDDYGYDYDGAYGYEDGYDGEDVYGYDGSYEYEYEYGNQDNSEYEHAVVEDDEFDRYADDYERELGLADAAPSDRLSGDLSDLADDQRHSVGQEEAKKINEENDGISDGGSPMPVAGCEQEHCDSSVEYDADLYWYDENSLPGYEDEFDACHECDGFQVEVKKPEPAPVEDSYDYEAYEYDYEAYEYDYDCDDYAPVKAASDTPVADEPEASYDDDYDYCYGGQSYDCGGDCDGYQHQTDATEHESVEAPEDIDYDDDGYDYGYDYQYDYNYEYEAYEPYQADEEPAEARAGDIDEAAAAQKMSLLTEVMAQAVQGLGEMFDAVSAEAGRMAEAGDWQFTEPAVLVDDPAPVPPGYGLPLDGDVGL